MTSYRGLPPWRDRADRQVDAFCAEHAFGPKVKSLRSVRLMFADGRPRIWASEIAQEVNVSLRTVIAKVEPLEDKLRIATTPTLGMQDDESALAHFEASGRAARRNHY